MIRIRFYGQSLPINEPAKDWDFEETFEDEACAAEYVLDYLIGHDDNPHAYYRIIGELAQ